MICQEHACGLPCWVCAQAAQAQLAQQGLLSQQNALSQKGCPVRFDGLPVNECGVLTEVNGVRFGVGDIPWLRERIKELEAHAKRHEEYVMELTGERTTLRARVAELETQHSSVLELACEGHVFNRELVDKLERAQEGESRKRDECVRLEAQCTASAGVIRYQAEKIDLLQKQYANVVVDYEKLRRELRGKR